MGSTNKRRDAVPPLEHLNTKQKFEFTGYGLQYTIMLVKVLCL